MPVLVTRADENQLISWSRNEAAVKRFSNAKIVHFAGGHAAFLEQPEQFLATVDAGG